MSRIIDFQVLVKEILCKHENFSLKNSLEAWNLKRDGKHENSMIRVKRRGRK